jgi:hypothetical protein
MYCLKCKGVSPKSINCKECKPTNKENKLMSTLDYMTKEIKQEIILGAIRAR